MSTPEDNPADEVDHRTAADYLQCGECGHYPAYHESGPCAGWDPDQANYVCPCPGWKAPKPKAMIVTFIGPTF